jgi:hypothetical protein
MVARCTRRLWLLAATVAIAVGCSSDAAVEPEPTLTTAGAFVAAGPPGQLQLYRIIEAIQFSNGESALFVILYDVDPKSYDEAREIAKRHDLPTRIPIAVLIQSDFTSQPYEVVWYRSLTKAELDLAR